MLLVASLGRAVADTVSPVGLGAEASSVTGGAGELGVGDAGHVVSAELLSINISGGGVKQRNATTYSARTKVLGDSNAGNGSDNGEGLHVDYGCCGEDGGAELELIGSGSSR